MITLALMMNPRTGSRWLMNNVYFVLALFSYSTANSEKLLSNTNSD
jgi:hypothetical protein